jgi:transposase
MRDIQRERERLVRENESLRRKLTEAERQIAEDQKKIAEDQKKIAEDQKKIADAEKQIADLERQLSLRRQNSTTSSKPPSSDGLAGEPRLRGSRRKKSARKPGGQPGHCGHWRGLAPPERVNEVTEVFPSCCRHCHRRFDKRRARTAAEATPRRHQVTELPAIEAHITEYQCHRLLCPACGKTTQADLPPDARDSFGPQLTALIAYLTVVCRMPRRVVLELLSQVLNIELSLGKVQDAWEEVSEAVAGPCAELERELPNQPVINSDETGYRTNGEKRWLWAMVAPGFVFYKIAATRGAEVLVRLLGEIFAGILCSDRCPSYLSYHTGAAQFCWAHFKRNVLGALEVAKTTEAERFCRDLLALHARLFRLWHRFRGGPGVRYGPIDRRQLILKSIPLQRQFLTLADRYVNSRSKDVRNLATALLVHFEKFFAFLEREGVEPTNNSAERALRCAVQWRKISFGSRSAAGEVAVARLLTVARTCQMRGRMPLGYLSEAVTAYRAGRAVQSLVQTASSP